MAKAKYEYWLTDDGKTLLAAWARDGLNDEQIAKNMGVSASTFYSYRRTHPEILETIKKGKEIVDIEVENALLKKALSGDLGAIVFWLKNRNPKKWKDKPVDLDTNIEQINKNIQDLADVLKQSAAERTIPDE